MDIKLGIGLDNIIFGSTESEIEEILGKPDRIRMDEEYEEFEPMLQFNSIKTRLTFYKNHGGKLGYMRSSNPDLNYKNKKKWKINFRGIRWSFQSNKQNSCATQPFSIVRVPWAMPCSLSISRLPAVPPACMRGTHQCLAHKQF